MSLSKELDLLHEGKLQTTHTTANVGMRDYGAYVSVLMRTFDLCLPRRMPFKSGFAHLFNCGFCRTFVHENIDRVPLKVGKKAKDESTDQISKEDDASQPKEGQSLPVLNGMSSNDMVGLNVSDRFKTLFEGPQFALGSAYFEAIGYRQSLFERHFDKIKEAFLYRFYSSAHKEMYVNAFSSAKWKALPASQKANHSLSNCVGCATQFEQLQELFPLKPVFHAPLRAIENLQPSASDAVHQVLGKSFAELVAEQGYKYAAEVKQIVHDTKKQCIREVVSQGYKSADEVKQIVQNTKEQSLHEVADQGYKSATEVKQIVQNTKEQCIHEVVSHGYKSAAQVEEIVRKAEKKCIRETQRKCAAKCSSQLDGSTIQALYATDVSFSKYEKLRKIQYYAEPRIISVKKRYSLQPHECARFSELKQALVNWDPAKPLVAIELGKEFNAKMSTDVSTKIRQLA